jgi:hypothetical protein
MLKKQLSTQLKIGLVLKHDIKDKQTQKEEKKELKTEKNQ